MSLKLRHGDRHTNFKFEVFGQNWSLIWSKTEVVRHSSVTAWSRWIVFVIFASFLNKTNLVSESLNKLPVIDAGKTSRRRINEVDAEDVSGLENCLSHDGSQRQELGVKFRSILDSPLKFQSATYSVETFVDFTSYAFEWFARFQFGIANFKTTRYIDYGLRRWTKVEIGVQRSFVHRWFLISISKQREKILQFDLIFLN